MQRWRKFIGNNLIISWCWLWSQHTQSDVNIPQALSMHAFATTLHSVSVDIPQTLQSILGYLPTHTICFEMSYVSLISRFSFCLPFSGSDGQSASHACHLQDLPTSKFLSGAWRPHQPWPPRWTNGRHSPISWRFNWPGSVSSPRVYPWFIFFHLDLGRRQIRFGCSVSSAALLRGDAKAVIELKCVVSHRTWEKELISRETVSAVGIFRVQENQMWKYSMCYFCIPFWNTHFTPTFFLQHYLKLVQVCILSFYEGLCWFDHFNSVLPQPLFSAVVLPLMSSPNCPLSQAPHSFCLRSRFNFLLCPSALVCGLLFLFLVCTVIIKYRTTL